MLNLTASHEDISKRFSVEITALQFPPPVTFLDPEEQNFCFMLMVPRLRHTCSFYKWGKLKVEDGFINRCYAKTLSYGVWLVLSY